jgi:hypothetical protein
MYQRPRSTMDSIRASEALDSGSIPDEATNFFENRRFYGDFFCKMVNATVVCQA